MMATIGCAVMVFLMAFLLWEEKTWDDTEDLHYPNHKEWRITEAMKDE